MLKERSFYNMNNSCLFWEKEKLFPPILAQDAVKNRSRECWQTDTKSIKTWISPSPSIEIKLSGKIFQKNPGTQRAWEVPPHLHISPHVGGWETCRQSRPWKKGTVPKRLPPSACGSGSPRSRQAHSLECLISHESSDGVNSGRFHFVLCQSNAFWEICFAGKSPSSSTLKPWDGSSVRLKTWAEVYWGWQWPWLWKPSSSKAAASH